MKNSNKIRFGVNYSPSVNWYYAWQEFDIQAIRRDMEALRSIETDHIRLPLRWDLFQPNAKFVSGMMLDRLKQVLDVCAEFEIEAVLSVFTGWLSGFWYLPAFLFDLNGVRGNAHKSIFTDPEIIEAEIYFLKELARAVGSHPALLGIDLGNEINLFDVFWKETTIAEGDAWLHTLSAACEELFPGKFCGVGTDHVPWFSDRCFSREALANEGNITTLHTWIKFCGATKYGETSCESLSLQAFNVELAKAYAKDPNRKHWIQEFGVSDLWMKREDQERFVFENIRRALECGNVWGFTWWCSHDISREFSQFHPMEYDLGLLDVNNRVKPIGEIFKRAALEFRNGVPVAERKETIAIRKNAPFRGWDYGEKFCDKKRQGIDARFELV